MHPNRRNELKWRNLFLLRHGESTANEINRFAGAVDAPLTTLGRAQARKAAKDWFGQMVDQVFASPLARAHETAEILSSAFSGHGIAPKIDLDGRLVERNFGDFTLKNKTILQRRVGLRSYEATLYGNCTPLAGGEDFQSFYERVLAFLRDELHPLLLAGKRVLVVAHKYVIELLARLILRIPAHEGYDLRLPNARVLDGAELNSYVRYESRTQNLLRDWIVVHHAKVLMGSAILGLLLRAAGLDLGLSPIVAFALLSIATVISLARVSLLNVRFAFEDRIFPLRRLLLRYVFLPLGIGAIALLGGAPGLFGEYQVLVFAMALILAAPTAITALTISRCTGGMIHPSVYMIMLSTVTSSIVVYLLLDLYGMKELSSQAFSYVTLSVLGLFFPMTIAGVLRKRFPIATAKYAEQHAADAVVLLSMFVVLAFQSIDLSSFWPSGALALVLGIVLRMVAISLTRHATMYAVDDYVSMSYPNIFLVIIIAGLLDIQLVMELATWFLVPMFALAPLDEALCHHLQRDTQDSQLLSFIKVATPVVPDVRQENSFSGVPEPQNPCGP